MRFYISRAPIARITGNCEANRWKTHGCTRTHRCRIFDQGCLEISPLPHLPPPPFIFANSSRDLRRTDPLPRGRSLPKERGGRISRISSSHSSLPPPFARATEGPRPLLRARESARRGRPARAVKFAQSAGDAATHRRVCFTRAPSRSIDYFPPVGRKGRERRAGRRKRSRRTTRWRRWRSWRSWRGRKGGLSLSLSPSRSELHRGIFVSSSLFPSRTRIRTHVTMHARTARRTLIHPRMQTRTHAVSRV